MSKRGEASAGAAHRRASHPVAAALVAGVLIAAALWGGAPAAAGAPHKHDSPATSQAAAPARAAAPVEAACGSELAAPSRVNARRVRAALRCLIDRRRTAAGLPPLRFESRLQRAARSHARAMVRFRFLSHRGRGASSVATRSAAAGFMRGAAAWRVGETLAWGLGPKASPAAIMSALMASPPHRRIVMSRHFTRIGVGLALGNPASGRGRGATYTLVLGSRRR